MREIVPINSLLDSYDFFENLRRKFMNLLDLWLLIYDY